MAATAGPTGSDASTAATTWPAAAASSTPAGLAVLDEVPELGGLLTALRQIDRLTASVIDSLIRLEDSGAVEAVTGVPVEQWLLIVGRRTGTDRRMLHTAAEVCRRLPNLLGALEQGRISWPQLRILALEIRRLPERLDPALSVAVDRLVDELDGADPDAVSGLTRWLVAEVTATPDPEPEPEPDDGPGTWLALQPRLDGTGGRFWGDADATDFAVLETLTDPGPSGPAGKGRFGGRRDPDVARTASLERGARRARRLLDLLEHAATHTVAQTATGSAAGSMSVAEFGDAAGTARTVGSTPGAGADVAATDATGTPCGAPAGRVPVKLIARVSLDTLLDSGRMPARLLTRLTGGHVRLSSAAARRLLDERPADLRTVVVDDTGRVVGVGRQTRIPPGWLADAVLAVHDTCTEPGCTTAALACDLDHARPWHPARADQTPGHTDADNLAPLCRPANRTKETDGWTAIQTADGRRTWRHEQTGLQVRTLPNTTPPRRTRTTRTGTDPP